MPVALQSHNQWFWIQYEDAEGVLLRPSWNMSPQTLLLLEQLFFLKQFLCTTDPGQEWNMEEFRQRYSDWVCTVNTAHHFILQNWQLQRKVIFYNCYINSRWPLLIQIVKKLVTHWVSLLFMLKSNLEGFLMTYCLHILLLNLILLLILLSHVIKKQMLI